MKPSGRKALKKFGVFFCIFEYLFWASVIHWLPMSKTSKQKLRLINLKFHGWFMSRVTGLQISVFGAKENLKHAGSFLMVSNHLSYLDIVAISALKPFVWVTSVEMGQDRFIGTLSRMAGAVFVERRNRDRVQEELQEMVAHAKQGFPLGLFPEGTSTNGVSVLKFKRTFFDVSKMAHIPILPLSIRYRSMDGEHFSIQNADRVCWYGNMDFFPHLEQLLKLRRVELEIHVGEFIHPSEKDDRRSLAIKAQYAVEELYGVYKPPRSQESLVKDSPESLEGSVRV